MHIDTQANLTRGQFHVCFRLFDSADCQGQLFSSVIHLDTGGDFSGKDIQGVTHGNRFASHTVVHNYRCGSNPCTVHKFQICQGVVIRTKRISLVLLLGSSQLDAQVDLGSGFAGSVVGVIFHSLGHKDHQRHIMGLSAGQQDILLGVAVEEANTAVMEGAVNGEGKPGMGCTATCAYIENDTLAIAHVGDSRAYLLHEGTLIRVTRDHSYVEELVDAGEITADEARVHPNRSVITRALGSDPAMYADHFTLHIEEGDRLILCSDGLSSMIPDSDIENIATQSSSAQICVDNLVDAALAAGGHDNVTVVVVDLVDDGVMREAKRVRRRNVTIATVLALVFVLVAGIWAYTGVTGSYYLGTYHGNVAVWRGLPGKTLGVELHWLESETSIKLSDLPEDTQNRLKAGIPQTSVDDAQDTISKYRHQIDEEQTRQVIDAQTIRDNTDQESTSESDSEKTAEQSAEAEASDKN